MRCLRSAPGCAINAVGLHHLTDNCMRRLCSAISFFPELLDDCKAISKFLRFLSTRTTFRIPHVAAHPCIAISHGVRICRPSPSCATSLVDPHKTFEFVATLRLLRCTAPPTPPTPLHGTGNAQGLKPSENIVDDIGWVSLPQLPSATY